MYRKAKRILGSLSSLQANLRELDRVTDDLSSFSRFIDNHTRTILAASGRYDEPSFSGADRLELMTRFNGMWFPIAESRFQRWMNESGEYQAEAYLACKSLIRRFGIAVDAGANVGFHARLLSQEFKEVHAFEPSQLTRACLARNVKGPNTVIYPFALSDAEAELEITVPWLACGGGHIPEEKPNANERFSAVASKERILARTLDSFNIQEIDFLKIDVQGFEPQVLRGASETLKRSRAVILVENELFGKQNPDLAPLLDGLGYRFKHKVGKDEIYANG